jgi:hypothetical protein
MKLPAVPLKAGQGIQGKVKNKNPMLIPHNDSLLPRIYNAPRNISQAPERTDKYGNGQPIVLKRNYPFQRSYLHTGLADTETNIYNNTNKVRPLRVNPVGMFIDIYA